MKTLFCQKAFRLFLPRHIDSQSRADTAAWLCYGRSLVSQSLASLCLIIICCLLSACKAELNRQYFLTHPQAITAILQRCEVGAEVPQACQLAREVEAELRQLSLVLRSNPQAFGQKILSLQVALGKARQQLQQLRQQATHDQTQLSTTSERVRVLSATNLSLLTVIRLTESIQ